MLLEADNIKLVLVYAISYFLDMEANVLTLKVLIRNAVLILIDFSALTLATSELILPDGFNTSSSL